MPDSSTLGFEIVVDFGDYEQETHESGFDLDFEYACAKECVLNLSGDNPEFVAGNLPYSGILNPYSGVSSKIFKENIYHFIDPAAFYGASSNRSMNIRSNPKGKDSKIKINTTINGNNYLSYQDLIYQHIVSKFLTFDRLYLYILGKRGRSYNFYNETPLTETSGPIRPVPDNVATYPPAEDFSTYGWPLKILTLPANTDLPSDSNYFTLVTSRINEQGNEEPFTFY